MQRYGVNFAKIVDFKWRTDYIVHADTVDELKETTFLLTITVQEPYGGSVRDISFSADVAQLQDFLGQVQDAIAQKK